MKQIQDQKFFLQEFKNLINSKKYVNMSIDEDENGALIRLEEYGEASDRQMKRERLLKTLEKAEGILKNYPDSVKREFISIANREGEEDREDSSL